MRKPWSEWSEAERVELEAAFVARHGAELLLEADAEPPPAMQPGASRAERRLPFARLYDALRSGEPLPAEVTAALRGDPDLRDDFALLVRRSARQHLPRAAAAAGREGLLRREAGGYVVRLVASRAGREQVYLLVELPEAEEATAGGDGAQRGPAGGEPAGRSARAAAPSPPGRIVVRTAEGEFLKQALPSPEARTIRLVLAADDPLVRAVGEPASELFLL